MQKIIRKIKIPRIFKSNYVNEVHGNNYQTIINEVNPEVIEQLEEMNRKLDKLYQLLAKT